MKVITHKRFDKQFAQLKSNKKLLAIEQINLFVDQPYNPRLRNHPLKGEWVGHRSFSIGGDLRIHYKELGQDRSVLMAIGKHAQLYK